MGKSKVFFTKEITPEAVLKLYDALETALPGKVAVKVHSGEVGNQNFIRPSFWKPMIQKVNGTIVECNTAYEGRRNTSEAHWQTFRDHGFAAVAPCDLMDEEGELVLPVRNGHQLKENYVGGHLEQYDSMLVLSHFKGHAMGGFGGAIKNISIGIASASGKAWIHSAGKNRNAEEMWRQLPEQDIFLESMAEAAKAVVDHCGDKILYISVMNNLSVDCDCDSHPEDPQMADIGILASLDPVALDKACVDMVYSSPDEGRSRLIERMESRHGIHTLEHAEAIGIGSQKYNLIRLDV